MPDRNTRSTGGDNPIPNTDEPRRPAQDPSPTPPPQPAPSASPTPGTQDATRPGVNQTDASDATARASEARVAETEQDPEGFVQRSGGGADNRTQTEDPAAETTGEGQPSE